MLARVLTKVLFFVAFTAAHLEAFAKRLTLVTFAVALSFTMPILAQAEDKDIDVASNDAEMNAAIDKARKSLPVFWARFASPASDEERFSLKLAISDQDQVEHFWCTEIDGTAEKASCTISNEPQSVKTVQFGQRVAIDPGIISDWMYYKEDKIVGGQTIRVLLPRLPEEEAKALRESMAPE